MAKQPRLNIVADTNLILRVLLRDDPAQFEIAARILDEADTVVLSTMVLCEAAWVLCRTAKLPAATVGQAFRLLLGDPRVVTDDVVVAQGLALLDAGGDFADGVIAAEGKRFGAATFVTFDRNAARLLTGQGVTVTLLS